MTDENIKKINDIIDQYFKSNPSEDWIPVKTIMPELIIAGVFVKDERKGLPIRKVLRRLDANSQLDKIPSAHGEKDGEAVYWYFVQSGKQYSPKEEIPEVSKKEQKILDFKNNDENYLVDLCDKLLGREASRQHTFDELVGNLHKRGKKRTKLPLDAYYKDLKLVLEFHKPLETDMEGLDEKEKSRLTQMKYYNKLKKTTVLEKEMSYIEVHYTSFETDDNNRLLRNTENDLLVLKGVLHNFLRD